MTELTEEQLKQMSPEQIAAMQKEQCIFCHILSGKVASKKVYEDDRCLAILDINPANPGHVLVLPKEHYSIMPLMPEEEIGYLFKIAKKISRAQIRGLKADGINIFAANGAAAGQKAPHFMIHLVPRKENDGITSFTLPKNQITKEDQEKLKHAIKSKVNEQFGIEEKEPLVAEKPEPETVGTTVEEAEETEEAEEIPEETEAEPEEAPEETEEQQQVSEEAEEQKEESDVFDVPPPEPNHEEFEKHKEEEMNGSKKKADLDSIGGLFK
jgi:histidine triad (HIT) family protein